MTLPPVTVKSLSALVDRGKGHQSQVVTMKTLHACPHCTAELETNAVGLACHLKKCARSRQWQRDYYLERGKWPDRKVNRTSFLAGGSGRRGGRSPENNAYDN